MAHPAKANKAQEIQPSSFAQTEIYPKPIVQAELLFKILTAIQGYVICTVYESSLEVEARTLLTTRNQLFKRIRGGAR